jgi:mannose-6-phosphate isomerase-like protein (cupin superfamily)
MKQLASLTWAALAFCAVPLAVTPPTACAQTLAGHSMVSAADLKWVDLPSLPAGARIAIIEGPMNEAVAFTARLRVPANYRIPPHWHPAVERVTVLSGTFHMGVGEQHDPNKAMTVQPGSFVVMQTRTPHYAFTTGEPVELQLHGTGPWGITYLDPADDPRKKP